MIQPRIQFNLANAREYFREHLSVGDYYAQGMKVAGEWLGHGAAKLGLEGMVNEEAFLALCEGKNPATGQKLGLRMNTFRQGVGMDAVPIDVSFMTSRLHLRSRCRWSRSHKRY